MLANAFRVGIGHDTHRLVKGRDLILGGIRLDHPVGLLGHSDADVLVHAACDALLGAAGLGDIGELFPDTDPAYRGISSLKLLGEVGKRLQQEGFAIVNLDAILFAEAPRLGPYKKKMAENIAATLTVEPARIHVKATTGEGLDAVGRQEAISATAIALICQK